MITTDALQHIQQIEATNATNSHINTALNRTNLAALPISTSLHNLEPYAKNRSRMRGMMHTTNLPSFAQYVAENSVPTATAIFVDPLNMSTTAVLNFGSNETPGHADNRAVFKATETAPYKALLNITSQAQTQKSLAEFLEDWPDFVKFFNGAEIITAPKAIAAIRKITIESAKKVENTEQNFSVTRSALETVQATSIDPLPTHIYFSCAPYTSHPQRTFVNRLTIGTSSATPTLQLRTVRPEEHIQEMGLELHALTDAALKKADCSVPSLLGSYKAEQ
jgi:uncharacterized protein YfdQ (DUF2303 family)